MGNPQSVYDLIETLVFVLPIAALIWKYGKQTQRVEDHESRIKTLEEGQEVINEIKVDIAEIKTSLKYIQEAVNEKTSNTSTNNSK